MYQFIEVAGGGEWRSEEDVWVLAEMKRFATQYAEAETPFSSIRDINFGVRSH